MFCILSKKEGTYEEENLYCCTYMCIDAVGTLMRPSVEEIIALKPSLVLLTGDIPTQQKVKKSLSDAHVKVKSVNVDNFQDYDKYMKEFTKMNKRSDLYEKNVVDVSKRIEAIKKKVNFKKQTYLMLLITSPVK